MDILTRLQRSKRMSLIKGKDTKTELSVRQIVHRMGYRYKLHDYRLAGKPDLVFPARRKVIFIHGCFWHGHHRCAKARLPKTRKDYWVPKISKNRLRDRKVIKRLRGNNWAVLVVWECEIKDKEDLRERISSFLGE